MVKPAVGFVVFLTAIKASPTKGGTTMSRATLYNCNMSSQPDITKCNTSLKRQKILKQSILKTITAIEENPVNERASEGLPQLPGQA